MLLFYNFFTYRKWKNTIVVKGIEKVMEFVITFVTLIGQIKGIKTQFQTSYELIIEKH